MNNTRFRRALSICTVIGAFSSVGVLSAQSFVPNQQYQYQNQQQFELGQQQDLQYQQQYQNPQFLTPPYTWSSSSSWRLPPGPVTPPAGGYFACMQAAETRKEQGAVQLYAWQYQQMLIARERQAQRRIASWSAPDERAQREEYREADREYRETMRAIDDQFDDVADQLMDQYREERRACDRLDDDDRRSFSSSSRSSNTWLPYQYSSYPTTAGGNGCAPIVCGNGRTVARCTPEGYPINYFADPCTYN